MKSLPDITNQLITEERIRIIKGRILLNSINKGAEDYGRQAVGESAPCAGV